MLELYCFGYGVCLTGALSIFAIGCMKEGWKVFSWQNVLI
jgi:hypothetical protein